MRREGPLAVAFVVGAIVLISNFFGNKAATTVRGELDQWYLIVTAFSILVGAINIARFHGQRVSLKREGWVYSLACLIGMFGMIGFGLIRGKLADPQYTWMYNTTVNPMSATMFGLLMFYIGSAAYRSFRVRTAEATVLLIAAVIVMLGRVPVGAVISPMIPKVQQWILDWPNAAGMRAIQLGATFGGVATAFRVLVGIERGYLGGE